MTEQKKSFGDLIKNMASSMGGEGKPGLDIRQPDEISDINTVQRQLAAGIDPGAPALGQWVQANKKKDLPEVYG